MAKAASTIDLSKRVISLDVLRGVAILMVMGQHRPLFRGKVGWFGWFNFVFDRVGWAGVDLFFVLSGFLIGGIIFREVRRSGAFEGRQFLIRRAFKIWPPYFALLVYAIFVDFRERIAAHELRIPHAIFHDFWPYFFHLQNYLPNNREGHLWSLAVEEHFYLVLGITIIIAARYRPNWLVRHFAAVGIFVIGLIALSRTIEEIFTAYTPEGATYPTHLRLDGLLFGVVLANIATFHPYIWSRITAYPWLLVGIAFCCVTPITFINRGSLFGHTAEFTMLYVGFGALLIGALGLQTRFADSNPGYLRGTLRLTVRIIAGIGIYSYGIYIWHIDCAMRPVAHKLVPHVRHLPPQLAYLIIMTAYVGLAFGFGALMTHVIEFPFLRLRDRLFPRVRLATPRPQDTSPVAIVPV